MAGLRNYGHLILDAAGLMACLAMAALLVYQHNVRIDLTPEKRYTLSKHSKAILEQIHQDVGVLAFTRREDPRNDFLEDLLWRVEQENPRVRSRVIDLNRNPSLARRYQAEAYGAVVVESEGRRKRFSSIREEILVAAILQVTRNYEKVVYFLTGHGERDIFDSDRYRGYSSARTALEQELYQVKGLSLVSVEEVPPDASVVVLAAPREDLLPDEILKLGRYVERGGSLLVLVDPGSSASLSAFLRRYGVSVPDEVVGDGDFRLASSEVLTTRVPDLARDSMITATLDGDPVFSLSRPVEELVDRQGPAEVRPLVTTSSQSWAIPAPGGEVPENFEYHAERDRRGPFPLGLEVRVPIVAAKAAEPSGDEVFTRLPPRSSRSVVYGDTDFANNFFIEFLGNRDLFVNTVNWLALEESLIGVRPVRKELGREQFFVSNRQSSMAFWLGAIIEPAIFLAFGIVIFVWRKVR
ncbi:MAG: GldG family protein [Candidatus Binatia bacterium]